MNFLIQNRRKTLILFHTFGLRHYFRRGSFVSDFLQVYPLTIRLIFSFQFHSSKELKYNGSRFLDLNMTPIELVTPANIMNTVYSHPLNVRPLNSSPIYQFLLQIDQFIKLLLNIESNTKYSMRSYILIYKGILPKIIPGDSFVFFPV